LEAFGNVRMQIANDILTGRQLKYDGNTQQADLQPASGEHRREDN
jgi:lipopolysaccharide export system protein LptA